MHYNPTLFRWEGNENALAPFDAPLPSPAAAATTTSPAHPTPTSTALKAAPALITKISATQGVQVVGGMVFDPQRMCWLKMVPSSQSRGGGANTPMSPDTVDDEDDPFAGLDDLEDAKPKGKATDRAGDDGEGVDGEGEGRRSKGGAGVADEWLVGEEFDVGPEFVRRQRAEEEKWRRKVEAWVGERREESERVGAGGGGVDGSGRGREDWRWAIRVLAGEGGK